MEPEAEQSQYEVAGGDAISQVINELSKNRTFIPAGGKTR